jgi:reactive chlorine resistance protein C
MLSKQSKLIGERPLEPAVSLDVKSFEAMETSAGDSMQQEPYLQRMKAMAVHFRVPEKASGSYRHLALLRWSMVGIFIWFGIQKFTPYAADAIAPLIAHSPFISRLSVFGVGDEAKIIGTIELTIAAALIVGSVNPTASALGAAMASGTFLLTSSFVPSTPGITQISPTGFPIISTLLEQFLLKDVPLLAACLTQLLASLSPRTTNL